MLRCCLSSRKMGLRPVLQVTAMNLQSGLPRWRQEADTPYYGARNHRRARPRRTVLRWVAFGTQNAIYDRWLSPKIESRSIGDCMRASGNALAAVPYP